jgi:hypothetical protein
MVEDVSQERDHRVMGIKITPEKLISTIIIYLHTGVVAQLGLARQAILESLAYFVTREPVLVSYSLQR